ncbi:MAG: extracellular solute-binding protein [Myxococcota bacterium]
MRAAALISFLALGACRVELGAPGHEAPSGAQSSGAPQGEVWIYTSLYQYVVDDFDKLIRAKLPGVEPKWFTGGSEKVSQRVDAELAAGGTRADILLISDPFFFVRMKREGRLEPYVPPPALRVDRSLVDADGAWLTSRVAAMVLVYNSQKLKPDQAPRSYLDLTQPALKGRIILGDPLASGTFFTTVAVLQDKYGWDYFSRLKQNGVISTGGNSVVIDRVSSGEYLAGAVLLENFVTAKKKGAPIEMIEPADGAVIIPGPSAIVRGSRNLPAAKAVMDLLFSREGQEVMVRGDMYAADPGASQPALSPPLAELLKRAIPVSPELFTRLEPEAQEIRKTFHQLVQE